MNEIERRRTFAIISHPDAGKTTLTEKFLLFGGQIQVAGAVKNNKIRKTATSDWMDIEKQRGISVSTSVMEFDYNGYKVNILDTPGHQDFAEDYFVDRHLTPKDENGEYDYESVYALNLKLINDQFNALFRGEEVELPKYNFQTGTSEKSGKKLKMADDNVLVVEGIHALNPVLTEQIPEGQKFRVYVSALTTILLDDHNYIPTTDNRLLRRIIRDYKYRGVNAQDSIHRWPSVRAGENKWIFPYQENADAVFNSAMLFELAVIKQQAEPLLEQVPENCEEYSEAYRLRKFLKYLRPIPNRDIPPTSLLREFLGGSSFKY